jgi:hypothetical protein
MIPARAADASIPAGISFCLPSLVYLNTSTARNTTFSFCRGWMTWRQNSMRYSPMVNRSNRSNQTITLPQGGGALNGIEFFILLSIEESQDEQQI